MHVYRPYPGILGLEIDKEVFNIFQQLAWHIQAMLELVATTALRISYNRSIEYGYMHDVCVFQNKSASFNVMPDLQHAELMSIHVIALPNIPSPSP